VVDDEARHRSDVDDAALALLQHLARGGLRAEEHAVEVDVDDIVPVLPAHLLGRRPSDDSRVIHQDVGAAQRVVDVVHHGGYLLRIGHIAFDGDGLDAQLGDLGGRLLGSLGVDVRNGDSGSGLGQRLRHGATQPLGCAGDDGDATVESELVHDAHLGTPQRELPPVSWWADSP